MADSNEENLRELLARFFDFDEAGKALEDIEKGERMLGQYPAPEPSRQLVAEIKKRTAELAARRKESAFGKRVYKTLAAAAAIIIIGAISGKLLTQDTSGPANLARASIIPTRIWESDDICADDEELAALTAEIEQAEQEVLALQLGENNGSGEEDSGEIETEPTENNGDFWEG